MKHCGIVFRMKIFDQLSREMRTARGVVQEAADAHQIAARTLTETAEAATLAFTLIAVVAVAALAIAVTALVMTR